MIPRFVNFDYMAWSPATLFRTFWLHAILCNVLNGAGLWQGLCKFVVHLHQPFMHFGSSTFHPWNYFPFFWKPSFVHGARLLSVHNCSSKASDSVFPKAQQETEAALAYVEAIQTETTLLLHILLLQQMEYLVGVAI